MNKKRLEELRALVEEVMYAPTKKEALRPLRRLEFTAMALRGEVDKYFADKLGEAIAYAKEASGQVKNKDHWISCIEQCWYVFENGVKDVDETKT